MSKYTTVVGGLCEYYAGLKESTEYPDVQRVCETAAPSIFEKFPIFDENYRLTLEVKILRHYYTKEICAETVGLWKLWLNNTMNEIMPYYNKLYETELLKFNPLYDVDLRRTHKRDENKDRSQQVLKDETGVSHSATDGCSQDKTDTQSTDTTHSLSTDTEDVTRENTNQNLYANTPQGSVSGPIFDKYVTDARQITDNETDKRTLESGNDVEADGTSTSQSRASSTSSTDSNTTANSKENATETIGTVEDYIENVIGKQGTASYSSMIQEYRDILLNIDMQVIDELKDLFMTIY